MGRHSVERSSLNLIRLDKARSAWKFKRGKENWVRKSQEIEIIDKWYYHKNFNNRITKFMPFVQKLPAWRYWKLIVLSNFGFRCNHRFKYEALASRSQSRSQLSYWESIWFKNKIKASWGYFETFKFKPIEKKRLYNITKKNILIKNPHRKNPKTIGYREGWKKNANKYSTRYRWKRNFGRIRAHIPIRWNASLKSKQNQALSKFFTISPRHLWSIQQWKEKIWLRSAAKTQLERSQLKSIK